MRRGGDYGFACGNNRDIANDRIVTSELLLLVLFLIGNERRLGLLLYHWRQEEN
jgi:hypothetical protein